MSNEKQGQNMNVENMNVEMEDLLSLYAELIMKGQMKMSDIVGDEFQTTQDVIDMDRYLLRYRLLGGKGQTFTFGVTPEGKVYILKADLTRLIEQARADKSVEREEKTVKLEIPSFVSGFMNVRAIHDNLPIGGFIKLSYKDIYVVERSFRENEEFSRRLWSDEPIIITNAYIEWQKGEKKFKKLLIQGNGRELEGNLHGFLDNENIGDWFDEIELRDINAEKIKNISRMFGDLNDVKVIDITGLKLRDVENMTGMFRLCRCLEELKFNMENILQNVRDTSNMFNDCSMLKKIDLTFIKPKELRSIKSMFSNCSSMEEINLSGWNTRFVNDYGWMFSWCKSLKKLQIDGFVSDFGQKIDDMWANINENVEVVFGPDSERMQEALRETKDRLERNRIKYANRGKKKGAKKE